MAQAPGDAVASGEALTSDTEVLRRWLDRDAPSVFASSAESIWRELRVIRELSGGDDAVHGAVMSHLPNMRRFLLGEIAAEELELPDAAEQLIRWLTQAGISVDVIMRAFEISHAEMTRCFARALRAEGAKGYGLSPLRRADVLELGVTRIFGYMNAVTVLAVNLFTVERARLDRQVASRRAAFVERVLGGTVDDAEAEQALAYPLTGATHVSYLIWSDDDAVEADVLSETARAIAAGVQPRDHLTLPNGERVVRGWFSVTDDRWRGALRQMTFPPGTAVAFGAPIFGVHGFRASYHQASEARRVARAVGHAVLTCYDDVAVVALASRDTDAARAFVDRQLGPLASASESLEPLRETLQVYLASLGSPTSTGRRLGVHPNTVIKRLDRIQQILELPIIDPASLPLRVALELLPLLHATTRQPS